MIRLLQWQEIKPAVYRRFMHRNYNEIMYVFHALISFTINKILISGLGAVHLGEQTADEIISEVDWDNMGDSE